MLSLCKCRFHVARVLDDPGVGLVVRVVQVGDGDEFALVHDRARLQASEAVSVNMKEPENLAGVVGHFGYRLGPDVDAGVVLLG